MSVNVYFRGIKAPTEEYRKKVAAYKALKDAGLDIPEELQEYFDYEEPDESGQTVEIEEAEEGDVMEDGEVTIDLAKLPPGVTHIKAILSY